MQILKWWNKQKKKETNSISQISRGEDVEQKDGASHLRKINQFRLKFHLQWSLLVVINLCNPRRKLKLQAAYYGPSHSWNCQGDFWRLSTLTIKTHQWPASTLQIRSNPDQISRCLWKYDTWKWHRPLWGKYQILPCCYGYSIQPKLILLHSSARISRILSTCKCVD